MGRRLRHKRHPCASAASRQLEGSQRGQRSSEGLASLSLGMPVGVLAAVSKISKAPGSCREGGYVCLEMYEGALPQVFKILVP